MILRLFAPEFDETLRLAEESRSKLCKTTVKPYDYTKQNSLYEIFTPQTEMSREQLLFANEVRRNIFKKSFQKQTTNLIKRIEYLPTKSSMSPKRFKNEWQNPITHNVKLLVKEMLIPLAQDTKPNASLFETYLKTEMFTDLKPCKNQDALEFPKFFEINELKAQLQDKNTVICELNKLNAKLKGKYVDTNFDKSSVVRQSNAFKFQKSSVLGKSAPFSDSLDKKDFSNPNSIINTNVTQDFSKTVTPYILPQNRNQAVRNMNVIKPGMYQIDTRTTQTRAPQAQLRSNQMKDKVVQNNSQVKTKQKEVEDHHRISSFSNKSKSVTACNDSLMSRTLNVKVVCATCGKCVFNSNHDACVSMFINDVNARTKKPNVEPINARKPTRKANQSVATPRKKTVTSEPTIQKSKSYFRMLYENTSKACAWWIEKQCPLVGQFYDADLEVAFRKSTCFVRDLQGNNLLTAKRSTFKTKTVPSSKGRLNLLHMDLCGPMRNESINGKKYILVIVDDYS
ncbi:hypothetical protein Tco_0838553 [Tanacetum coccineum]|uniref:Uncharacterized protein n=1 Tax=Tanacetum coccineum TaxID=301880 RepID=A0ABQ5AP54_9ASTR